MHNGFVYNGLREFKLGMNLPCRINPLIWVMSGVKKNIPPNLCNLNSSWVDDEGAEGDVVYQ
jgi:hypothetical protein